MQVWDISSEYKENDSVVEQILTSRGVLTKEQKEQFLSPPHFSYWFKRLPRELLESLKGARDIIKDSIEKEIPIIIHGDYDADGICATTILYKTIKDDLGYEKVYPFIPNRFEHGYGLSEKSIDGSIKNAGLQPDEKVLFITVDTGITAVDEVKYAKGKGHRVIVTDHHQKPNDLPNVEAIVWYDQVVGATVSYLLSASLGLKDRDLISLCCIATITDLQPVLGFNRTIVKEGLSILNEKPQLGVKSLFQVAGVDNRKVTTGELGWIVGPRLNASGRIEDPKMALDLLIEDDPEKVSKIAWELNQVNVQRQDKTLEMYEIAKGIDEDDLPKIIVSHNENYHEGIIGLVASRLAKKYYRPAVVISTLEENSKGSVRSIKGINIIEVLREVEDLFTSLGGHPMAAGFSIKRDGIPKLEKFLEEYSKKFITDEMLKRVLLVDLVLPAKVINQKLMDELNLLRPYGMGNREPVFATYKLSVAGVNIVGRDQNHMSLRLFDGDNFIKAIFFNYKDTFDGKVETEDVIDVAYSLKRNEYNGKVYTDLIVKDIRKSKD